MMAELRTCDVKHSFSTTEKIVVTVVSGPDADASGRIKFVSRLRNLCSAASRSAQSKQSFVPQYCRLLMKGRAASGYGEPLHRRKKRRFGRATMKQSNLRRLWTTRIRVNVGGRNEGWLGTPIRLSLVLGRFAG
jgi:hypothetical protein